MADRRAKGAGPWHNRGSQDIPSGAVHVNADASAAEETSLIFWDIGGGHTAVAKTVWLDIAAG